MDEHQGAIERAAAAILEAQALLIGAGAGMSVDAGIPAYRLNPGDEHGAAGAGLGALNPGLFRISPPLAWGRAGAQLALFRRTAPHAGYAILKRWAERAATAFVLTSNVDGMFLRAGFPEERLVEGHGSLHHLQCTAPCGERVWSADDWRPDLDERTGVARPPLPRCPDCGGVARPNVLMFGDSRFNVGRSEAQARRFESWLAELAGRRLTVVECGAGTAVPTIRKKCERLAAATGGTLIRINPTEHEAGADAIRIPLGALEALQRIDGCCAP
jgi:NAD-dependent SIR2 family protein deacetylase